MNRIDEILEVITCRHNGEEIARINGLGMIELKMYNTGQDNAVWLPIWKGRELIIRDFLTYWYEELRR